MLLLFALVYVAAVSAGNPEENVGVQNPNLFEGDMVLTDAQRLAAEMGQDIDKAPKGPGGSRGAIKDSLWEGGVLVYDIADTLANRDTMNAIVAGMKMWTDTTCIRFKKRTNERAYVYFNKGDGCSSAVGKMGYRQYLSLDDGCWSPGIVAHELGHALGFYHEQSRPDRDDYVHIYQRNIMSGMGFNFQKYTRSKIDSLGTPYDYGSIMHYSSTAFSKDGRPTILAKKAGVQLGQRNRPSDIDTLQMNLLYKCSPTRTPTLAPTGGGSGGNGNGVIGGGTGTGSNTCNDWDNKCSKWASNGECKISKWMQRNCKKSCNLCSGCTDYHKDCVYWASIGECTANPLWMEKNCLKSCKICT